MACCRPGGGRSGPADADVPVGPPDLELTHATGSEAGDEIINHPAVKAISFTGSNGVGIRLYEQASRRGAKVQCEMGGKNPVIVTKNADIEKALDGTVRAAFGFSGQKCSAASRAYVERPVYEEFVSKLAERAKAFKVGDPTDRNTGTGPVIDESAVDRFLEAVESAKGGTIRAGGVRLTGEGFDNGTYVAPTVVDGLPADHELFKRELFLPFLVVAPVKNLDQALDLANDTEYGLTAGIFSEDNEEIRQFFDRIEAGEPYFHDLRSRWSAALRAAHQNIPRPPYKSETEAKK